MPYKRVLVFLAVLLLVPGVLVPVAGVPRVLLAAENAGLEPPKAKVVPTELEKHGDVRIDNYYWLRERDNPEVIEYLEAENAYTAQVLVHTEALQETLFQEIKGRIKENDESVPYRLQDYYYYVRYVEGGEYPIYCRKKGSLDAPEEVMLDANEMAAGHDFFQVTGVKVSSGQDILAFAVDTVGRRKYTIRFKNLATGELLPDEIPDVTSNSAWAEDNRTLLYTRQDPTTLRWVWIYSHALGSDPGDDPVVYEEKDETFDCYVFKTKSRKYLIIGSDQTLSNEYRFVDAADPSANFTLFMPREREHEYEIEHFGDYFYIKTNWEAENSRLMRTPVESTGRENWEEVIPHREDVLLQSVEIFQDYLVLRERKDGLTRLRIRPWSGEDEHYIDFGEPAYYAWIDDNPDFDTHVLRFGYTSLTTPNSIYDYDMQSQERTLLKQDEVLGGFERENYRTERIHARARDGAEVPVSLVYREGTPRDGTAPLLLYGYGSYGYSMEARFRGSVLSLLDRGFIFAIAHVRGGQELGRRWYEDGKLFKKMNTFTDFIDCAETLIEKGYADPERVFAEGGSAGGLLMGAVVNLRPDLWRGVVADVPFVDVMTTMLDDTIPLTTSEYDEWGNPNEKDSYDYMLSYSPYDNVEPMDYPNLLVTTGLHDSQVQYWEPAKWVAKLRATKTDPNWLLLHTNMDAGHGGQSGRFRRYREVAMAYAFMLDLAGIHE